MKAVKYKDSAIEKILRIELWHQGMRYRKNVKDIFGKPDIVFIKKKKEIKEKPPQKRRPKKKADTVIRTSRYGCGSDTVSGTVTVSV